MLGVRVSTAPGLLHLPTRRTWECRACDDVWLCDGAKAELLEIYEPFSPILRELLNFFMVEAVNDFIAFRTPEPRVMAERIYGWFAEIVLAVPELSRSGSRVESLIDRRWMP